MRLGEEPDRLIAALATVQHGAVESRQLKALGVTRQEIAVRVRRGRLHRLCRGVYLVGDRAAPPLARQMAAVLACGPGALISHRTAAAMWGFLSERSRDPVDVTVIDDWSRERPGIRVHRSSTLRERDRRRHQRIPLTSPARTLLDLAAILPLPQLESVIAEAQGKRLVRRGELVDQLERNPGRPGSPSLRALLDSEGGPKRTRSEMERGLLRLVRSAGLPEPETNTSLGAYEPDLLWRRERLVVEFDSWQWHSSRRAFERDRQKDASLVARGYRVIRVTWRQLEDEPEAVVARIAAALALASG